MRRLALLLVLVLLAATSLWTSRPNTVYADGWDVPSLTNLLLTGDELTSTLGCCLASSGDATPSSGDHISVGRYYTSTEGDFIDINLFASPDAAVPPPDLRDFVLGGGLTQEGANAGFDNVTNFSALGVVSNNDVLCTFTGDIQGTTYNVTAVAFIKNNVVGLVFYSTQKPNPDPTVVGLAYRAELKKIP